MGFFRFQKSTQERLFLGSFCFFVPHFFLLSFTQIPPPAKEGSSFLPPPTFVFSKSCKNWKDRGFFVLFCFNPYILAASSRQVEGISSVMDTCSKCSPCIPPRPCEVPVLVFFYPGGPEGERVEKTVVCHTALGKAGTRTQVWLLESPAVVL